MFFPKISIVIPIYNVEKYLKRCLDSVKNQTYNNFEVILVNDGTTDLSASIAEDFVRVDDRFKLIHQENKGLSGARNTGLKEAKGDYVFYLDSDDILVDTALELLVNAAVKYQADVVQGNFYYDYPEYLLLNQQQQKEIEVYNKKEAMSALLEHKTVLNFAWGKLIKRELAQKHTFPVGKFYEDTFWKYKIIHDLEKYVALKQPILYYLQRGSAISGAFSIRNIDQLEGELQRLEFLKKHYPKQFEILALKLLNHKVQHHYSLLSTLTDKEQKLYKERLEDIEATFRLKEKFPNNSSGLIKKIIKISHAIKNRILGSKEWKKINK
ncbi:glycosyltransferase family 2 protein [Aequorivita sinensis]|uniref:glycosyltransferase family 2 protein n=1 Tax=Aequorivita sinensis TaxID=1382458 RepID=UPI0023015BAC|nr:glycosyltransferase family 2 protein [Aequorivita sinensis]